MGRHGGSRKSHVKVSIIQMVILQVEEWMSSPYGDPTEK
jgi:hypothetical protein